jgi:hypothetical protein
VSGKKQTKVEFAHKFCQSYSVSSTFCMMKIECDILVQVLQSIERLENGRSLVISMADDQLCVEPGSELIDPQRAREPQLSDHGPRGNFLTTTGVLEVASEDEATEDEICPTSDEESEDNKAFSDFSDAEKSVVIIDDSSESTEEGDTLPPLNSKRKDQSRKVEILEESSDEEEIAYEFSQKQELAYKLFEE